jgi:Putative DNA-binding domain
MPGGELLMPDGASLLGGDLLALQRAMAEATLGDASAALLAAVEGQGLDAAARLRIYGNHAAISLTAALKSTYPVICRLVDERFFDYAAHSYRRTHPPRARCLAEYGHDFPAFLEAFAPCRGHPYLPDVAWFEWALQKAANAGAAPALTLGALATVPAEETPALTLRLQPSLTYLASPWPVDHVWEGHRDEEPGRVALDRGPVRLEIRRLGDGVAWLRLPAADFAFREALARGGTLASAAAVAAADTGFDLARAIHELFAEGLVVGFHLASPEETTP